MDVSSRARFVDRGWHDWLANFPEYDRHSGHVPSVIFAREVTLHLANGRSLPRPCDSDHATLRSELESHFKLIGIQIGKKVDLGLLSAVSGAIGLIGDFFIPGTSLLITWISGMLIVGGAGSKLSAALEVKNVLGAQAEVERWLRTI
ncbi:MAG: hypothetical protein B7Z08_05560 [Sphingomonadales bacterium 32-68-7]|nr:MAG: hypothetical protein B7Z33_03715 [Sphingomonadales bacterium 12-68-11]OYX09381.1 MAG: hypothetical protein B7Z08_05560 [Sphingomonadales bacterium 32-68-7]